jgi:hypothetical protein
MHPDLYLVVYRQSERELEQRLARRLDPRAATAPTRSLRRALADTARAVGAALRPAPRSPVPDCCPA